MTEPEQPKADKVAKPAGRGCLLYGCLSLFVLVLVLLLAGFFTARYLANTFIDTYTETTERTFETTSISDEQRAELMKRYAEFKAAKGTTNNPVTLELTGPEINALIAQDKDSKFVADHLRVDVEDDHLVAHVSIPLKPWSDIPLLGRLKDRYLNGILGVGLTLENGSGKLSVRSAEINGTPVPQDVLDSIEQQLSMKQTLNSPGIRKNLDQLDWIRIKDGRLRIGVGGSTPPSE